MAKRGLSVALAAALLLMLGASPVLADEHEDLEVELRTSTLDEFCEAIGDASPDEIQGWTEEELAHLEQRPTDDYAELLEELDALRDRYEDGDRAGAYYELEAGFLLVWVAPHITRCEGFEDREDLHIPLDAGVYVYAPTLEEFCPVVDRFFEVDGDDVAAAEAAPGQMGVGDEAEPVDENDGTELDRLIELLTELFADAPDADILDVYYEADVLLIELFPPPEDCVDETPVDGVPAGAGGTAGSGMPVGTVMLWVILLAATAAGGVAVGLRAMLARR